MTQAEKANMMQREVSTQEELHEATFHSCAHALGFVCVCRSTPIYTPDAGGCPMQTGLCWSLVGHHGYLL